MKRWVSPLRTIGLLVLCVAVVLGLLILILGFLLPDSVNNLRLGGDFFRTQVTEQTDTLIKAVKINPLVDVLLVAGSYLLVSLINWSQDQVVFWYRNRRHFE